MKLIIFANTIDACQRHAYRFLLFSLDALSREF